eukprot:10536018-Ditylum_brightwellii.AAC.1
MENGHHLYDCLTSAAEAVFQNKLSSSSTGDENERNKEQNCQDGNSLVVLAQSSHQVMEERPDDVAKYIFDFMMKHINCG